MNYDDYPPATLPTRDSWQRAPKFRENLSQITIAPPNPPRVEKSQFSPDSPTGRPRPSLTHARLASTSTAHITNPRNLEDGTSHMAERPRGGVLNRITEVLYKIRRWGKEPEVVQIQPALLPPWPPLHVEKRVCKCEDPKQKKRRRWWIIALIVILLYLLANTVALNVRVLKLSSGSTSNAPGQSPSTGNSSLLSSDQQQCISQFTVNAPTNPSSFPCSSCLPLLSAVPESVLASNPQDGQTIQNAVQFCGLQGVFSSTSAAGQQVLSNGNWLKDVKFCAWTGVQCGGSGLVSSVQLTFPAVPATIPNELGFLTGLQTLQVIGNGALPGGSLPGSFGNLSSLSTLHLESTGMNALPDNLFSSLSKVISLTLVKNSNFGGGLPSTLGGLSLQSLVINGQTLSTTLASLFASSSLQKSLKLLDLSSTGLSTSIPSSVSSLSSLVELHLDDNSLQPPIPPAFPPSLQILTLSNNTALSGSLPSSLCSSANLKTCTLTQTGLASGGACGPCKFT